MRGGFVLDFSNRTFEEFFREVVGVQIYETRFDRGSGSKANRMRAFWDVATKEQLQLFFNGLLEGWPVCSLTPMPSSANTLIQQILKRMEYSKPNGRIPQLELKTFTYLKDNYSKRPHGREVCLSALAGSPRMGLSHLEKANASYAWMEAIWRKCCSANCRQWMFLLQR